MARNAMGCIARVLDQLCTGVAPPNIACLPPPPPPTYLHARTQDHLRSLCLDLVPLLAPGATSTPEVLQLFHHMARVSRAHVVSHMHITVLTHDVHVHNTQSKKYSYIHELICKICVCVSP